MGGGGSGNRECGRETEIEVIEGKAKLKGQCQEIDIVSKV